MPSKKKRRREERPSIHPRNKYAENPPDFSLLASLYPSFNSFVFYSRDGRPRIDWTDFNATSELTRVLLLHDHGLNWWIPDGQLCPTVPNRSNYIHWIEDLLSSDIIVKLNNDGESVRGFDIGTGANCIYPLLGASLLGWNFVASDVTDIALEWAEKNVSNNPHISHLIEVRKVEGSVAPLPTEDSNEAVSNTYQGPPILVNVVRDGETFDFCMCNPPFFESMEEAGLNPKTACGGTPKEMVCPGGEKAFITRIIEDSFILKQSFRWYTSMVGRKSNLKFLVSKLWVIGATVVKTTEFVQGQTSRWGLAWSFMAPAKKVVPASGPQKSVLSFMLEGLQRQYSAMHVLQSVESLFLSIGASCELNPSTFTVNVTASSDICDMILTSTPQDLVEVSSSQHLPQKPSNSSSLPSSSSDAISLRISVFQQIPGTLLIKGSLQQRNNTFSGALSSILPRLENVLKLKFCREKGT